MEYWDKFPLELLSTLFGWLLAQGELCKSLKFNLKLNEI